MINRRAVNRFLASTAVFATVLGGTGSQAAETLKIGGIGTLTGGGSAWGLAIQRGTQLAIDEARAAGGVKAGSVAYMPELVMYDDNYTGQGGKTAMDRLLFQDGVKFVLGPIGSPSCLGAIGALDDARVNSGVTAVLLHDGAAIEMLKNKYGAPYNFLVANTNREYGPAAVAWYQKKVPDLKKVAILAPNDAVGQSVVPALIAAYKNAGIDVWFEMYERGTKEFTPLITRMLSEKVDALDLDNNSPGDSGLIFKQARQSGFRGKIWQTGGPAVDEVIGAAGRLSEGFLSYDLFDFGSDRAKPFVEAYRAKYGQGIINAFTPIFYNAARILFAAIGRAESIDPTKVRDAIQGMNGYDTGLFGEVKWGGMDKYGVNHQLELPFLMIEVINGKAVPQVILKP